MTSDEQFSLAIEFLRRRQLAVMDEERLFKHGRLLLHTQLPLATPVNVSWLDEEDLNFDVVGASSDLVEEIGAAALRAAEVAGLREVRIEVLSSGLADDLSVGLAATGYERIRASVMALDGAGAPLPEINHSVEELDAADYLEANQNYLLSEGTPPDVARQLAAAGKVVGDKSDVWRRYGARLHSSLACCCELHLHERVARPENLFTFYGARRQGYAASVFTSVLEEAFACDAILVFVVVLEGNAEATPLYTKLGFREIGVINFFEANVGSAPRP